MKHGMQGQQDGEIPALASARHVRPEFSAIGSFEGKIVRRQHLPNARGQTQQHPVEVVA